MFKPGIYQGRFLGEAEIAQVRGLIVGHPQWHRNRISEELAGLWGWRSASGQLKRIFFLSKIASPSIGGRSNDS